MHNIYNDKLDPYRLYQYCLLSGVTIAWQDLPFVRAAIENTRTDLDDDAKQELAWFHIAGQLISHMPDEIEINDGTTVHTFDAWALESTGLPLVAMNQAIASRFVKIGVGYMRQQLELCQEHEGRWPAEVVEREKDIGRPMSWYCHGRPYAWPGFHPPKGYVFIKRLFIEEKLLRCLRGEERQQRAREFLEIYLQVEVLQMGFTSSLSSRIGELINVFEGREPDDHGDTEWRDILDHGSL